jgi:hypothetical protein
MIFPHAYEERKEAIHACVFEGKENKIYQINLLLKRSLWSRFTHHQIDNRYVHERGSVTKLERISDLESHGTTRENVNLRRIGAPNFYVFYDEIKDKRLGTVYRGPWFSGRQMYTILVLTTERHHL